MPEGLAHGTRRPSAEADERQKRFAALLRAERSSILATYANRLQASSSVDAFTLRTRGLALTDGDEIIAELIAGLADEAPRAESPPDTRTAEPPAEECQRNPAEMVRATTTFFGVTVNTLAAHVRDDPELLASFITALGVLNESIGRRLRAVTLGHTGYLLERVDQAHINERRRIARELHDRLGEGMSAALRQLELHEITGGADSAGPASRVAIAKDALTEAMHRLRIVTSGLREKPVRSLEVALVNYIDSASVDAEIRLRVSGDEKWAPSAVIEEAFLIIREAIRNALSHAAPRLIQIGVALAPYELNAWVEDDGRGFLLAGSAAPASGGTGLNSMRERAAALAGRLTIASVPGHGTQVELLVPLPGHHHA